MTIQIDRFGIIDNVNVDQITLTNTLGSIAKLINYGATLQSLCVRDKNEQLIDIVLGYDTLDGVID